LLSLPALSVVVVVVVGGVDDVHDNSLIVNCEASGRFASDVFIILVQKVRDYGDLACTISTRNLSIHLFQ
jgi:hypothetical protein